MGNLKLNREEHRYTKHDPAFSEWKVLVGANDWEEHSKGREGRERYRVENLPKSCSSPGLYELAVSPLLVRSRRRKPDPDRIAVVYLGQADNVRSRLQQYGRSGSHLEDGPTLFSSVFSMGYSIVFRWAHMPSKLQAEATEAQLLRTFDYAWNKGCNGPRRPADIVLKLYNRSSSPTAFLHTLLHRLRTVVQRPVGVHIDSTPPVFKTSRSRPRPVSHGYRCPFLPSDLVDLCGAHPDPIHADVATCGARLEDGFSCRNPPVEGRKRCTEHKGMRAGPTKGSKGSAVGAEERKRCTQQKGVRVQSVARSGPGFVR